MKIAAFNGNLFFKMPDGSSIACGCIGEPFTSQIVVANKSMDGLNEWALETATEIITGLLREEGWVLPDCSNDEKITTERLSRKLIECIKKRIE